MAMLGRKSPQLKGSDLNKAVLEKNKKLKSQNDALSKSIKYLERSIKVREKELEKCNKTFDSNSKALESQELSLSTITVDIDLSKALFSELEDSLVKFRKEVLDISKDVISAVVEKERVKKDIIDLSKRKIEYINSKLDMNLLISKKDSLKEDIDKLSKSKKNAKSTLKSLEKSCEDNFNKLKIEQASLNERKVGNNNAIASINNEIKLAKSNRNITIKGYEKESNSQQKYISQLNANIDKLNSQYTSLENELKDLQEQIDFKTQEFETLKASYNTFRVSAVAEVARLKLKDKLKIIDKAGLSDIING